MAAAAFLIRDGDMLGRDITILEESGVVGGSLDGSGKPETGYVLRGGRMFESKYVCSFELFSSIPALSGDQTVTQEILGWNETLKTSSKSRLIRDGRREDAPKFGLSESQILTIERLAIEPEVMLESTRISDQFDGDFFKTNFWFMWCTTFAFEPWHSAIEFRRYLNRFIHLFPTLDTMSGIYRTRYNQYDSIVRPLQTWLAGQGVSIRTGCRVTDLAFARGKGTTVNRILLVHGGRDERIPVGPDDLVLVTNGSMTADSSLGSDDQAPEPAPLGSSGAWQLWQWLARGRDDFGNPHAFSRHIKDSTWESFTVTTKDPLFAELLEAFSGREAGRGGLLSFPHSNWLLSIVLNHQPVYPDQPEGVTVWWGYGLYPDRPGDHTGKPMTECTGQEILREVLHHLKFDEHAERIAAASTVVPALMPYITSQFLVRERSDRPQTVPKGSVNLAFIGQFAEVPDDVVFTVEYSVRTAWTAVARLLHLDRQPPPVYQGHRDPRVLARALETMHRR